MNINIKYARVPIKMYEMYRDLDGGFFPVQKASSYRSTCNPIFTITELFSKNLKVNGRKKLSMIL